MKPLFLGLNRKKFTMSGARKNRLRMKIHEKTCVENILCATMRVLLLQKVLLSVLDKALRCLSKCELGFLGSQRIQNCFVFLCALGWEIKQVGVIKK